jgi:N-acetylglucosamine-6-phosphate deacetylase
LQAFGNEEHYNDKITKLKKEKEAPMNAKVKITNGKIITPSLIIPSGTVMIANGLITGIVEGDVDTDGRDVIEIDAHGKYVAPGFIDIHVHGGGGFDFMDGTAEAFLKIAEMHVQYGTTSMVPTILTSDKETILRTFSLYEEAKTKNVAGAQFLGMHLEGPYFAMNQRGAQDPRYIRDPDPEEYKEIISKSSAIKRWSAAPELNGSLAFGRYLRSKGIIAAIAHTDAVYEEVLEAVENGFSLVTHLYSGMSGVTRRNAFRYAGVVESAFVIDDLSVEIIADGIHLPAPLLKLVYKIKGPDKIALVTDAMRAAGMSPGESILGSKHNGLKVIVEDGVAKLPDKSAFAGSVATTNQLLRTMVKTGEVPLLQAVKMITSTPARIMKVDDYIGSLLPGKNADIVIFDNDFSIDTVMIQGNVMHSQKTLILH